jgi:hypothetical protein
MALLSPSLAERKLRRKRQVSAVPLVRAPVAQWKSDGLLSRGSEVRILPGALLAKVRPLRGHDDFFEFDVSENARVPRPHRSAAVTNES